MYLFFNVMMYDMNIGLLASRDIYTDQFLLDPKYMRPKRRLRKTEFVHIPFLDRMTPKSMYPIIHESYFPHLMINLNQ